MINLLGQSYQKALSADPSYKPAAECLAIVLTDLGTSLKLAGNTQEGIQKYYEALRIDPHYAVISCFLLSRAFFLLIFFLLWVYLFFFQTLNLNVQPAYYNLGVVYSEMMQYDTALSCYEKAALERPLYAEAYCNMGVIYKNRGDLESAIACYERYLAKSFTALSLCLDCVLYPLLRLCVLNAAVSGVLPCHQILRLQRTIWQ